MRRGLPSCSKKAGRLQIKFTVLIHYVSTRKSAYRNRTVDLLIASQLRYRGVHRRGLRQFLFSTVNHIVLSKSQYLSIAHTKDDSMADRLSPAVLSKEATGGARFSTPLRSRCV